MASPNFSKAAQVAAAFIERNGGSIEKYALIKMMYFADREALKTWSRSLTETTPYSMEHGPVLSEILNLTNGCSVAGSEVWKQFISDADAENVVTLKHPMPDKDRLSKRDLNLISAVFSELRDKTFKELKAISHALPEYEEVFGTSKVIPDEKRRRGVGKRDDQIKADINEVWQDNLTATLLGGVD